MDMLTITNLKKNFGDKKVLCGLNLSVPEHSVFGFVGKNGAGKTTTMKAALGLLNPDEGEILASGKKVVYGQTETNRFIGYLPDVPEFYSFMTPPEYLMLCGRICGMKKSDIRLRSKQLLELVGLAAEKRRIKGFSRGMKQRLGIAQALLGRPKLLICDEPTSALDPVGRKEILDLLLAVREETTVLFSTHILSDVERICTDVAFLHNGKNVMQGKVADIKKLHSGEEFAVEVTREEDGERLLQAFPGSRRMQDPHRISDLHQIPGTRHISDLRHIPNLRRKEKDRILFQGNENQMLSVLAYIAEHQITIQKAERLEPSLEALFLEVSDK